MHGINMCVISTNLLITITISINLNIKKLNNVFIYPEYGIQT